MPEAVLAPEGPIECRSAESWLVPASWALASYRLVALTHSPSGPTGGGCRWAIFAVPAGEGSPLLWRVESRRRQLLQACLQPEGHR